MASLANSNQPDSPGLSDWQSHCSYLVDLLCDDMPGATCDGCAARYPSTAINSSGVLLLVLDAFIAFFCLMWFIRIATDLQRTDAITFDRILQLPLAFSQAFVINYFSSLVNFTFLALCSFGIGFWFGSCFSIGPKAILFPIPFVCFLVAISALTYQMQGWLAAIMSNPRRRQMIMILVPFCVIVVSQIPAILATRFAKSESQQVPSPVAQPPKLAENETPPETAINRDAAIEGQAVQALENSVATDTTPTVETTAKDNEDAAKDRAEEAR